MAGRMTPLAAAVALALWLAAAPAVAGFPPGAGVARAVAGQWAAALDEVEAVPGPERTRAEQYFQSVARLELGLRGPALAGLRALSDSGGPFSGPALELGVETLFAEGRYARVVEWVETSASERFQDADALHYRVGQSHLLLDHPDAARVTLARVTGGSLLPYALHSRALLEIAGRRFGPAVDLLGEAITAAEDVADSAVGAALADTLRVTRGRVLYQLAANVSDLQEVERVELAKLARKQFERVPEGSALYPDALRGIGWCVLETGDSSRSLASFAAAGGMDPEGRPADLWAQGRVYERLGFYDEAARLYREAAEAAGVAAEDSGMDPGRLPETVWWERRGAAAGALEEGRVDLDRRLGSLVAAADARDRRLADAARQIDARRQRVAELRVELSSLAIRLKDFLDQIPAAALFPRGERGRVRSLGVLQQRLDGDVTRIENALGAIGGTVFWTEATAEQRARGREIWARLGRAKESLWDLQLGFLLALKERVSQRELELATQIEQLQQGSQDLDVPLAKADQARLAAVSRGEAYRSRVAALAVRSSALVQPLERLRQVAGEQVAGVEARARDERSGQLRLAADAYALDEAQALHLMQEPPR